MSKTKTKPIKLKATKYTFKGGDILYSFRDDFSGKVKKKESVILTEYSEE